MHLSRVAWYNFRYFNSSRSQRGWLMNKRFTHGLQVLIVDDEPDLLTGLKRSFTKRLPDTSVLTTTGGREALDILEKEEIALVLMDIMMGDMDGLEVLDHMHRQDPEQTIIMMTGYGTIELAVDAIRRGAWDFVTKPLDLDSLTRMLHKGLERSQLLAENKKLRGRICPEDTVGGFIGQSPPMLQLYQAIRTTAGSQYNVLIRGDSGTGKEICARAIHNLSDRCRQPFVMVNCPAIPEHLLESELFGYRRGAFTGANKDHAGLFIEANRGTICLDEIGDIPISIQTKLLRVLQEQEIKQLGASSSSKIDVRIIASTNRALEDNIAKGTFREDLFYRLEVLTLHMPTLEERVEDIPLLADHFLKQIRKELNSSKKTLSSSALELLMEHSWPGNVRELQNVIHRTVMFCPDNEIGPEHLAFSSRPAVSGSGNELTSIPYKEAKNTVVGNFAGRYVASMLRQTGGNVSEAARRSGLTRAALQKIIRRYAIHK